MSAAHFANLSGIRGLAAAVVLLSHIIQIHFLRFVGLDTPLHHASSLASEYAVVIFFILSGYLITHTLEANIERNGKLRLDLFLAARFARLYPPLLLAIAVSLVAFMLMGWFGLPGRNSSLWLEGDLYGARDFIHLRPAEIGNALAMMQGMLEINGPLWSLYIEAKLYVLFACGLALITGHRHALLVLTFFIVAWAGLRYNPGFSGYAAIWLTGCLAYYVWSTNRPAGWRNRALFCSTMIAIIILAELVIAIRTNQESLPSTTRDVLVAMAIGWLLFRFRISIPVGKRLGDCSYSLYVTHFPILLLAQSILISSGSRSVMAAVGVAMCGLSATSLIALAGGKIETYKGPIQSWLLSSASRTRQVLSRKLFR